jgi:hypothetical protein
MSFVAQKVLGFLCIEMMSKMPRFPNLRFQKAKKNEALFQLGDQHIHSSDVIIVEYFP